MLQLHLDTVRSCYLQIRHFQLQLIFTREYVVVLSSVASSCVSVCLPVML